MVTWRDSVAGPGAAVWARTRWTTTAPGAA